METSANTNWIPTANRFVGFFDIMGFKDFVYKNNHEDIKDRVKSLANFIKAINTAPHNPIVPVKEKIGAIVVSDSVIISTLGNTKEDLLSMIATAGILITGCLKQGIPIKGGVSYGKFTFDKEESLYVGEPLIDAAQIESTLDFYGCVIDHNIEKKMVEFGMKEKFESILPRIKVPTKEGLISYRIVKPQDETIKTDVLEFYLTVSGKARRYVDNTLDVYSKKEMM